MSAVLIAIGIEWEGRRNVLSVDLANRESATSWKDFLALKERGLDGVEFRALAVETHENWLEAIRYLNMAHLAEHKKEALRKLEQEAA